MAFAYTIQTQTYEGNGIRKLFGTWTGSAGDAAGTIAVAGDVRLALFQKRDPLDNTYQIEPRIETSKSGAITTITVENQDNVLNGIFEMTILGN